MNERNDKGSTAVRLSLRKTEQTVTVRTRSIGTPPVVADSSAPAWKTYCANRLRHFASGR
jgi:hypothetical protein